MLKKKSRVGIKSIPTPNARTASALTPRLPLQTQLNPTQLTPKHVKSPNLHLTNPAISLGHMHDPGTRTGTPEHDSPWAFAIPRRRLLQVVECGIVA
jgi:hypothetical protein